MKKTPFLVDNTLRLANNKYYREITNTFNTNLSK